MARRTRDARYTRTVGSPPFVGRRYVSGGRVRIEWTDNGRRRQRTIGPNTVANRQRADETLHDTLRLLRDAAEQSQPGFAGVEHAALPQTLEDALRALALAVLDLADVMVERVERALERRGVGPP